MPASLQGCGAGTFWVDTGASTLDPAVICKTVINFELGFRGESHKASGLSDQNMACAVCCLPVLGESIK